MRLVIYTNGSGTALRDMTMEAVKNGVFDGWTIGPNGYVTNCAEMLYSFQLRWRVNRVAFLPSPQMRELNPAEIYSYYASFIPYFAAMLGTSVAKIMIVPFVHDVDLPDN